MIIRKIRKDGIVNSQKAIKWIIILIIALLLIKGIAALIKGKSDLISNITPAQIGTSVLIQGYLNSAANKFPHYTHTIVDEQKNVIGLKSATINLNAYNGKVEIIGVVEKFLKLTPILEVTALKLPNRKLVIKNNSYFFADDFLLLDFSTQPQLSAIKSGNHIQIMFDDKEIVEIERFACGRLLKGQSCSALIGDYAKGQKENFTSFWGYQFYKHAPGNRVGFEGEDFGYIFKNVESDDMMLDLSNMIKFVNREFILANKLPEIKKVCGDGQESLAKVSSSTIDYAGNALVTLKIRGQSDKKNTVNCTISFDTRNQRASKKISFEEIVGE